MKFNIDLTATAPENSVTDELYSNVGASAFNLEHDLFYGGTDLEIWTSPGQTGTQLVEDTDYVLGGVNDNYSALTGVDVYTTVTVTNASYQSGNLYFTYQALGDFVDANDRYLVVRSDGHYWELTSGGAFELWTTATTASSIKIDSAGGIDIDSDEGFNISDDSGASIVCNASGQLTFASASGQNTVVNSTGAGGIDVYTSGTGNLRVYSDGTNTNVNAVQLYSIAGGIDVDAIKGINIKDTYALASTGTGISLVTDNTSTGTGGTILLRTQATSGTAGAINVATSGTNRLVVNANGNTIFYGTASTSGALPVITLDQADVDEPFIKVIGDAAAATLTNDLVADADVGSATIAGYFKVEIQDDGNQITDGDYYVPFYTLS